jgi:hypothetical protein
MLKDGPMPGIKTLATHFLSHGVKLTIVDDGLSRHSIAEANMGLAQFQRFCISHPIGQETAHCNLFSLWRICETTGTHVTNKQRVCQDRCGSMTLSFFKGQQ